jgi:hypothetical protein
LTFSCTIGARIYYTLEIWQSSCAAPARVVADVGYGVLGIEPGAPRDGGAMVTFIACPFTAESSSARDSRPRAGSRSRTSTASSCRRSAPRSACGNTSQVLYREYLGSDLTEPAYGPIEFELHNVQMSAPR